jgi:alginate O-acetyltransferase complex protein AlgJ
MQTRAELARRPHPLLGKRVLVWQFAARELAVGDWKPLPLPSSAPGGETVADEPADKRLVVKATIVAASRTPAPSSVPYKDCLTFMKVRIDRVVQGSCPHDQVIAAFWGLRDNLPQPAARYVPGDHFQLTLTPLAHAAGQLQSVRYADDLNDYEHPTYFVEECRR